MARKATTVAEFINVLLRTQVFEARFWIDEFARRVGKEDWQCFLSQKLDCRLLEILVSGITAEIMQRLSGISEDRLYYFTTTQGHKFLQEIHAKAVAQNLNVGLEQIDGPLTPSEMMVDSGLITVDESHIVRPTPKAKGFLQEAVGR